MRGFFVPPKDDDYTFMIRSDDSSELYLSTDDDPANKVSISLITLNSIRCKATHGHSKSLKCLIIFTF